MKTIVLSLGLLLGFFASLYGQKSETLFENAKVVGAFGSPFLEYGKLLGEEGLMVGGGGALQFQRFFLGGYGIGTNYPETVYNGNRYVVNFGHGGFWLGYTIPSHKLFHAYISAKTGWGRIRFKADRNDKDRDAYYSDRIFAFTPELGVEVNVTDFMRIALTGGYRLVADVDALPASYTNEDFSGFLGGLTFRFGSF
ncbi:MAG: hypothetical protein H6563_07725 [Lewinellaceae bacterium]|nr:hypothetical protein [Lewinellaceae bacterium]